MWPGLLTLVVLALIAAILLWPRSDFVIRVRDGAVKCEGTLPLVQHGAIARLILDDLRIQGPVTIRGTRGSRLRLRFRGAISPEDQQCVRNFFAAARL
jgi:hypothetical protein